MTYADEIRRQAEAAPRAGLPAVTAALWRAYGEGQVTEAEAEALSGLIEARRALAAEIPAADRTGSARRRVGSRPRTDASMERRRRWAAAGRMPPAIAARFTLAEAAVLAVVAAETVRRGDFRMCHDHVAAVAGVSRTTVKATLRRARSLGLITIEERRVTAWRNLPNVIRIVSREWQSWMRLARRSPTSGGGVESAPSPDTGVQEGSRQWLAGPVGRAARGREARPIGQKRQPPRIARGVAAEG